MESNGKTGSGRLIVPFEPKKSNMESYWSHYAKVMEYNRQRILLQNPHVEMSYFDIPYPLLYKLHHRQHVKNEGTPQYKCNTNLNIRTVRRKKIRRKKSRKQRNPCEDKSNAEESGVDEDHDGLEFVIDDGFMKFLEISMEHKLKRKKQMEAEKHREKLRQEEDLAKGTNLRGVKHQERKAFKRNLYGEAGDKIMAMENAIDINFNQQKDLHRPVLWPNIALNLKF